MRVTLWARPMSAAACVGEAQAFKPLGPPDIKVSLEANFVQARLVMVLRRYVWCPHAAPRSCSSCGCISTRCMRSLLQSEDTGACSETASPHVLIDVLIYDPTCCAGNTQPRQVVQQTCRGCVWWLHVRHEILSLADGLWWLLRASKMVLPQESA